MSAIAFLLGLLAVVTATPQAPASFSEGMAAGHEVVVEGFVGWQWGPENYAGLELTDDTQGHATWILTTGP